MNRDTIIAMVVWGLSTVSYYLAFRMLRNRLKGDKGLLIRALWAVLASAVIPAALLPFVGDLSLFLAVLMWGILSLSFYGLDFLLGRITHSRSVRLALTVLALTLAIILSIAFFNRIPALTRLFTILPLTTGIFSLFSSKRELF